MVLQMCAVYDVKAEAFMMPMAFPTVGSAMRAFDDTVNRDEPGNSMRSHPEDYVFYQIGTYDDKDGLLVPLSPVRMLCAAVEVCRSIADRKVSAV